MKHGVSKISKHSFKMIENIKPRHVAFFIAELSLGR